MPTTEFPYRIPKTRDNTLPWLVQQNLEELRAKFDKFVGSSGGPVSIPTVWCHDLITADVNFTAISEATAQVVRTTTSRTYDTDPVFIDFFAPGVETLATNPSTIFFVLLRDTTVVVGRWSSPDYGGINADDQRLPARYGYRDTPGAGAHTYTVKVYSTLTGGGVVKFGTGAPNTLGPGFIRVTKDVLI